MDMVGIVRGLIAEPELVNNARDGRERESRICIAANHCASSATSAGTFGCAINPVAGREERWGVSHRLPATTRAMQRARRRRRPGRTRGGARGRASAATR